MKIIFNVNYRTNDGETLHAVLHRANAGMKENQINIPLKLQDGQHWSGNILLGLKQPILMAYHYEVRKDNQIVRREYEPCPRTLALDPQVTQYTLQDHWRDTPAETYLFSCAFTELFAQARQPKNAQPKLFKHTLGLRVQLPKTSKGQSVWICGNTDLLGNWNPDKALPLTEEQPNEWVILLDADFLPDYTEYKFLLKEGDTTLWQEGGNCILNKPAIAENEVYLITEFTPRFNVSKTPRFAGCVVPVFSLRSQSNWGTGDFGSLKLLVDWAVKTGQHVLQLLPVNDTSVTGKWTDSYPYNAISVYALHPLYANVSVLPGNTSLRTKILASKVQKINQNEQLDYEKALAYKLDRLHIAFEEHGKQILASEAFRQFFAQQVHWLPAYAMFCVLRDQYKTSDFRQWEEYKNFSHTGLVEFTKPASPHYEKVSFWYYVQFVLHVQLREVARYAREHNVVLKGDIPIGISPTSVEAWTMPSLFNLNTQAGAPPDDFSETGQNWGFPTYNWAQMAKDNFFWWRRRLTHMAQYFDLYRLDHVLGFFRIWEIPTESVQGLLGHFSPALPLSKEEIISFGFEFKDEYLFPHITDELLQELFGDLTERVKTDYLVKSGSGTYSLRPAYDTQRKVAQALNTDNPTHNRLREGLYRLIANVLFVKDTKNPNLYHPRIGALKDEYFTSLSKAQQQTFTRLYNDFYFYRHDKFWKEQAMQKLPALTQATRMLACAEDLGMIPACVPEVMHALQMLTLEIQRMPKEMGKTFADTTQYPYLSVATPSTHDMSVLRGWWQESPSLTQKFWRRVLHKGGMPPQELDVDTAKEILMMHLQSPSMLALIGLQDWTAISEKLRGKDPEEERINVPANPHHYWCYRMPMTLEDLLKEKEFNAQIKEMITQSGR